MPPQKLTCEFPLNLREDRASYENPPVFQLCTGANSEGSGFAVGSSLVRHARFSRDLWSLQTNFMREPSGGKRGEMAVCGPESTMGVKIVLRAPPFVLRSGLIQDRSRMIGEWQLVSAGR